MQKLINFDQEKHEPLFAQALSTQQVDQHDFIEQKNLLIKQPDIPEMFALNRHQQYSELSSLF